MTFEEKFQNSHIAGDEITEFLITMQFDQVKGTSSHLSVVTVNLWQKPWFPFPVVERKGQSPLVLQERFLVDMIVGTWPVLEKPGHHFKEKTLLLKELTKISWGYLYFAYKNITRYSTYCTQSACLWF